MSTILEALKKSEQERKLSNIPTLADMPTPQEPSRWQPILLLLILFLLLILVGFAVKFALFPSSSVDVIEPTLSSQTSPVAEQEAEAHEPSEEAVSSDVVVNVVSYSDTASKRFIMIDGKLIREGEFVRAGLKVEEIRQHEVVLNLRGEQIIRRP